MDVSSYLKIIMIIILTYLAFALVSTIIPYTVFKKLSDSTKEKLNSIEFNGDKDRNGPDMVRLIESPTEAFSSRIALVRESQSSIIIVNHVIQNSICSQAFLGEILSASKRGVKIKILLDGTFGTINHNLYNYICALNSTKNISCRFFNIPKILQPWKWQALLHDKIMLVDKKFLLLGGRNISEKHFNPKGFNSNITHDRDVLVLNTDTSKSNKESVIAQCLAYFKSLWKSKYVSCIKKKISKNKIKDLLSKLKKSAQIIEKENPEFYDKNLDFFTSSMIATRKVTLLNNPITIYKKQPTVAYCLNKLIKSSTNSVVIQTPYATANELFISTLDDASKYTKIKILTNSMASSPNFPAYSNYFYQRHKFLKDGIQIYEYQNKDSIHAKSMIIDKRLSMIGSFNMDDRSVYIDTESLLIIDSTEFAEELNNAICSYIGQSLEVGSDGNYILSSVIPLPIPIAKQLIMRFAYSFLKGVQFLL